MISNESLNAVIAIADRANKTNVALKPLEHSVLAACVTASTNHVVDNFVGDVGFSNAWQDSLQASPVFGLKNAVTVRNDDGENTIIIPTTVFAKTLDDASDIIADAARNAMNIAQNVATPLIGQLIDDVNAAMEGFEGFAEKYEIVDITPSEAWNNPIVVSALGNFSNFATPKVKRRSDIPRLTIPSDYAPELRTGSASVDTLVNSLLESGETTLLDVVGDIFNGNADAGVYPAYYWESCNGELLKFLVCQWLIDNPIPGSGMSGVQWSTITHELSNAYGSVCYAIGELMKADVANKKLFYKHDTITDQVFLNGTVYDQWLNAGGSPELVFGALMNGDYNAITYDSLIENANALMHVWTSTHTALSNSNREKRTANLREATFSALLQAIDNCDANYTAPGVSKADMVKCARVLVHGLSNAQLDQLETTAIDVICDVLLPHTPSKFILREVNNQLSHGVSAETAILEAVTTYISTWVSESILICKA